MNFQLIAAFKVYIVEESNRYIEAIERRPELVDAHPLVTILGKELTSIKINSL